MIIGTELMRYKAKQFQWNRQEVMKLLDMLEITYTEQDIENYEKEANLWFIKRNPKPPDNIMVQHSAPKPRKKRTRKPKQPKATL